jgi:hypothetical protein
MITIVLDIPQSSAYFTKVRIEGWYLIDPSMYFNMNSNRKTMYIQGYQWDQGKICWWNCKAVTCKECLNAANDRPENLCYVVWSLGCSWHSCVWLNNDTIIEDHRSNIGLNKAQVLMKTLSLKASNVLIWNSLYLLDADAEFQHEHKSTTFLLIHVHGDKMQPQVYTASYPFSCHRIWLRREARKTVEQRSGRWYKLEWHIWTWQAEVWISLEQITFCIQVHVLWACEGHDLLREYRHRYAETGVPSSHWVGILVETEMWVPKITYVSINWPNHSVPCDSRYYAC